MRWGSQTCLPDFDILYSIWSEKSMATYSSTLAWKIPWMEKPGGLQSMGSLRVGHNRATSLSVFTFMHWRRKWQPTPVFLPGAWWADIYGVAQSWTRLKWLSSKALFYLHLQYLAQCLTYSTCSNIFLPTKDINYLAMTVYLKKINMKSWEKIDNQCLYSL